MFAERASNCRIIQFFVLCLYIHNTVLFSAFIELIVYEGSYRLY